MHIAEILARWANNTHSGDIPEKVKEKARLSFLDTIGVTIAGNTEEAGKIITRYIQTLGGKTDCSILGTYLKTALPMAALANGVLGHALDLDDNSYSYFGHVSVSVLPAALATGEFVNASGDEVICSYIIGAEVACKFGACVTPKLYEDGWHTTTIIGPLGATVAAGKLLKLDEVQMTHALGITVSELSGIKGSLGTHAKPFQVGRSAENGVVAALLAKNGLISAPDIFEKAAGFFQVYKAGEYTLSPISNLGQPYDIDDPGFYLKEFPSCSSTHPALNAMIRLIKKNNILPENVLSVDCTSTPLVVGCLTYDNPLTRDEGRFSMQFCLALALLGKGEVKITNFNDEKIDDMEMKEMMRRISLRITPGLTGKNFAPHDGPEAAVVTVTLKDGRQCTEKASFADWRPGNMPSWNVLSKKYQSCASLILPDEKVKKSIEMIRHIEELKSIRELVALLVL